MARREALALMAGAWGLSSSAEETAQFRLGVFRCEVTPPLKHPLLAGLVKPAERVEEPLELRGFVLTGKEKPVVVACIDWCEIRNGSYDAWRGAMARAAGTEVSRVFFSSIHQHDAPLDDLDADRLVRAVHPADRIIDEKFHLRAVESAVQGIAEALRNAKPVTHVGTGSAKVEQVASNRKTIGADGKPSFGRMSATADKTLRDRPEGTIDPRLRALSFWNGETPLVVLNSYSVHPMSYYGQGGVSVDFVGLAREQRQKAAPGVMQIYGSGASGNTVAGKYNDGNQANRKVLAQRLASAMQKAMQTTVRKPLRQVAFRQADLQLEARDSARFTRADLEKTLRESSNPRSRSLAALGLSWRNRVEKKHPITVPVADFSGAKLLLLPGESYVEYQLFAQSLLPDEFVMTLGYGECGPGYIPTDQHFQELDGNLNDWCWVNQGSEKKMQAAIRQALLGP